MPAEERNSGTYASDGQEGRRSPGRPPGSPNKVGQTIKQCFIDVFNKLQEEKDGDGNRPYALETFAKQHPDEFYKLASKLIPTEVESKGKLIFQVRIPGMEEEETDESNAGESDSTD